MVVIYYLNIKAIRIKKQLTQKELAAKLGISQSYLSLLERNNYLKIKGMRLGLIDDLAEALEVDPNEILKFSSKSY